MNASVAFGAERCAKDYQVFGNGGMDYVHLSHCASRIVVNPFACKRRNLSGVFLLVREGKVFVVRWMVREWISSDVSAMSLAQGGNNVMRHAGC